MLNQKRKIFRQESLERLSSPERLDQLMQVVAPKDWLSLASLGSLVLLAIGWSVFGKIPVTVTGRGVLLYPYRTTELQVRSGGQLKGLTIKVGDRVRKGDVIGVLDRADLQEELNQQTLKLAAFQKQDQQLSALANQRATVDVQVLQQQRQTLQQSLQDTQGLTPTRKAKDLLTVQKQRQAFQQTLQDKQALIPNLNQQLNNRKQLYAQGAIAFDTVLEATQAYQENLQQIANLNAQLQELDSKEIAIEQSYRDAIRQTLALQAQLSDLNSKAKSLTQQTTEAAITRKNQLQAVQQTIAQLALQLRDNGRIISKYNGRVLEMSAKVGQVLSQGAKLGIIQAEGQAEGASQSLSTLVYFPIKDGKQIQPGMTLQITPDTVKRERFGGILGKVKAVSAFPVTKEGILSAVGNAEVTESLMSQGGQVEVLAVLDADPTTMTGYKWSSSRGPELQLSPGTTASVRVTVSQWSPITFVLPILRSVSGIN
ncbi:MAG: NHLP bacteriocin system secretion protein [Tildeniella nuda ZEHNDER 1965/U140]|jgi:HlyD family secretion protein|nr:NHLP bacteriocin system secretion protein [Tildeniella nuda ZEHNDER 1965/U140]